MVQLHERRPPGVEVRPGRIHHDDLGVLDVGSGLELQPEHGGGEDDRRERLVPRGPRKGRQLLPDLLSLRQVLVLVLRRCRLWAGGLQGQSTVMGARHPGHHGPHGCRPSIPTTVRPTRREVSTTAGDPGQSPGPTECPSGRPPHCSRPQHRVLVPDRLHQLCRERGDVREARLAVRCVRLTQWAPRNVGRRQFARR